MRIARVFLLSVSILLSLSSHVQSSYAQSSKVSLLPYLSIRGAGAPALSPDGKWIVFTSSVSNTTQLWKIPAKATPDGNAYWPEQLTFFPDAVGSAEWSPDGKWILFRKDVGGNERHQLYLIRPNGADLDTLTNNPKAIFGGGFTEDGKSIIYQSNERNEAYFDIYLMDLATRKTKLLHQSDHQNGLIGLSRDNRWLFISRDEGNASDFVYVKDITKQSPTEEPRLLTPHTEPATHNGFYISPDNKRLHFFSDEGREFSNRAYVDFQDPNAKVTFKENVKWDLDQDIFSPDGNVEVITRNVDGISEITILNTKTGKKLSAPHLPEGGFISNMQITHNGSKIAFNYTSPTEPGAIYVHDIKKNKTERVTIPNYAGIDPKSFVSSTLIHYPSFDGKMIPAYFYKANTSKPAPVIVTMHGGPESQDRPWFNSLAQYFLQRGYSVLDPNVRGSTGYGKSYAIADNTVNRMVSVRDMEAAALWLKKQSTVDTSKLIVFGGSYGGFMTLAAMTMQPDIWAAGVDLFGIANFHSYFKNTGAWRTLNRAAEYGDPVKDSAFLVQISPLTYVDRIKKPLFVYQGKNDPRVPAVEAEQIVEAVRKRGIPVEYIILPDEGHGLAKRENRISVFTSIIDFLDKVLVEAN